MGRRGSVIGYWREDQKKRVRQDDENVDEWIILKCILERYDGWYGRDWSG
jgi:hypothetical protein